MKIEDVDIFDELAMGEPELCQNCRFFAFRKTKPFCSHPEVNRPTETIVQCGSKFFLRTRPWFLKEAGR